MSQLDLTSWQRHRLRKQLAATEDVRLFRRTLAVLEFDYGRPAGDIARMLGVTRQTVYNRVETYRDAGDPTVLEDHRGQSYRPLFDEDAEHLLEALLTLSPQELGYPYVSWTVPLLRAALAVATGQQASENTVRRTLRRLDYVWNHLRCFCSSCGRPGSALPLTSDGPAGSRIGEPPFFVGIQCSSCSSRSPAMLSAPAFRDFVRRVRAGDQDAARELVRRYEPAIRRIIHFRLVDKGLMAAFDSMDFYQSVLGSFFIRAVARQSDLSSPDQLVKLPASMARNKLASQARMELADRIDRRRATPADAKIDVPAPGPSPSSLVINRDLLEQAHRHLSVEERQLVELRNQGLD